jgi:predicted aspartyl protease
MTLFRSVLLVMLALLAACAQQPAYDCQLTEVARMPLDVRNHLLVVPVGIDGKRVSLLVDTGAERTTLSYAAAERLGLSHDARYTTQSVGVGGASSTTDVKVDSFVLGETRFPITRLANVPLTLGPGLQADGLLGADILLAFDLDIDVPDHTLTLYKRRVCPDLSPPWPSVEVPGVNIKKDRLLVPIVLDGAEGTAILDTGAQGSLVGPDLARRLGLSPASMSSDQTISARGVGPGVMKGWVHQFQLLRIGSIGIGSPRVPVLLENVGIGDMLIGEDVLQGHRVWLSFRPAEMFMSK